ncbi:MAG: (2Fe-2S)-binding protein [Candidatus Neomarinimicrobiota bacterium]
MTIEFILNDRRVAVEAEPGANLLEMLRERGLFSVKHGCDHGECGACTVLLDERAVNACLVLAFSVAGKRVETVEKFSSHDHLHPLQEKFIASGAIQCGFCTPGMILALEALRREKANPTESDVRDALAGNLCRCTGYVKPVEAAQ